MTVDHKELQRWSAPSARFGRTASTLLDSMYTYVHRPFPPAISHLLKAFRGQRNRQRISCLCAFPAVLSTGILSQA